MLVLFCSYQVADNKLYIKDPQQAVDEGEYDCTISTGQKTMKKSHLYLGMPSK